MEGRRYFSNSFGDDSLDQIRETTAVTLKE
jgi:hypothetical protein